jgi:hypothetical protein
LVKYLKVTASEVYNIMVSLLLKDDGSTGISMLFALVIIEGSRTRISEGDP